MKTLSTLSIAAMLLAMSGGISLAQDAGAAAGAAAETNVEAGMNAEGGMAAGAEADMGATYEGLIAALGNSAAVDIGSITTETEISIIAVSELEGEDTGLDEAMGSGAEANTALQAQIEANAALTNELEAAGYTAADVIAVATPEGAAILYIDDRA